MPLPIESYALIGDCHTAALVGIDGSIDWLCFPRFDSGACFAALLGGPEHGRWLIAPTAAVRRVSRRYRDETLVLQTDFETDEGSVRLIDYMPLSDERWDVVRIVEGLSGSVALRMELIVRFDYGSIVPWVRRAQDVLLMTAGPDTLELTGSIGVIMVTLNAEGLMQKLGLAAAAIKSGERKDMGSPFRALTDDERKILQSVIDGLHSQFLSRVVEARKLPLETARTLSDGRVYTAQQALELKLIDRIGYMDDALQVARHAIGVDEARVIVYHRPSEYRATYYARSEPSSGSLDLTAAQLASVVGAGPRFLYLWWP